MNRSIVKMSQTGANFRRYFSIASINGFRRTVTPAVYEEDDIHHHHSFSLPFTLVGLYHNQFCTNEEINKSIDKYLLCNVNLPFPLFVLNILQYTDAAHSRSLKRSAAHSTRCLWQGEPQRRLAGFLLRRKPLLQQTSHSPGYRGFNYI